MCLIVFILVWTKFCKCQINYQLCFIQKNEFAPFPCLLSSSFEMLQSKRECHSNCFREHSGLAGCTSESEVCNGIRRDSLIHRVPCVLPPRTLYGQTGYRGHLHQLSSSKSLFTMARIVKTVECQGQKSGLIGGRSNIEVFCFD